jgi:hypothetical protein
MSAAQTNNKSREIIKTGSFTAISFKIIIDDNYQHDETASINNIPVAAGIYSTGARVYCSIHRK